MASLFCLSWCEEDLCGQETELFETGQAGLLKRQKA
jgi:hypothetical protein